MKDGGWGEWGRCCWRDGMIEGEEMFAMEEMKGEEMKGEEMKGEEMKKGAVSQQLPFCLF